jgi:hypothetical protein
MAGTAHSTILDRPRHAVARLGYRRGALLWETLAQARAFIID